MSGENALVEALESEAGGALRVVAEYDRDGYDVQYVRDDVDSRVRERADAIHRNLVLEGISRDHLEDMFGAGDLRCSMHRFETVTAFHFSEAEYRGLFVSIDSEADLSLKTFTDTCWQHR
ncbi:hypothetical protein [Halobacterium wangiae]|uniref:hypothetical protein n=1 Tax=Halobacterium wangiae TaxID=2902623 RepID=UPI001E5D69BC|nr:hypothetical protein [Halobacterium wangiae]